jgi:hypothetical protein
VAADEPRPPSTPPATPPLQPEHPRVPNLIDQFQQRHSAWLAQADDLIRLREEVQVAAEHKAVEIVTAARRDVRRIVIDARRELLALTAHLQAAADATTSPGAAALPQPVPGDGSMTLHDPLGETRDHVRSARRDVRSVLDEARAEIDALMAEAAQPLPTGRSVDPAAASLASAALEDRAGAAVVAFRSRPTADAVTRHRDGETEEDVDTERPLPTIVSLIGPAQGSAQRDAAERVLDPDHIDRTPDDEWLTTAQVPPNRTADASRMTPRPAPVETLDAPEEESSTTDVSTGVFSTIGTAAPARLGGRRTALVLSIAAAAAVAALTATFVLSRPSPPAAREARTTALTRPSSASATGVPAAPAPASSPEDLSLSLTIEARQPAWIELSVDGQEEAGRTVPAGEMRRIVGARSVAIRAGDAGAVYVAIGNGRAEPLGNSGAVITRRFTASDGAGAAANANNGETPAVGPGPGAIETPVSTVGTRPAPAVAPAPVAAAASATDAGTAARAAPPSAPDAAAPASTTAPPVAAGSGIQSGARTDLVQAGQLWLDAYHRRDRAGMAELGAEGLKVSDERSVAERFQWSQGGVRRELDQVELELTGDTAVMTARMTERAEGVSSSTLVSRVSQVWIRRTGRWQLSDVRLIAESRLNQLVR